jgi:hypothetical protein
MYSHGIGDATSGQIIVNIILSNYQQQEEPSFDDNLYIQRQSLDFLPNIENLGGMLLGEANRLGLMAKLLTARQNWKSSIIIGESVKTASGTSLNSFVLKEFQPLLLCRLKVLCKEKGVTIGTLLITALHFGIAKLANCEKTFSIPWTFDHDVVANLRDRITPPLRNEHVALLIAMFSMSLTLESVETIYWQCAEKISDRFHIAISNQEPISYHAINRQPPEDRVAKKES